MLKFPHMPSCYQVVTAMTDEQGTLMCECAHFKQEIVDSAAKICFNGCVLSRNFLSHSYLIIQHQCYFVNINFLCIDT